MLIDTHCHLDMLDLAPYNDDINLAIDAALSKRRQAVAGHHVDLNKMDTILGFTKRNGVYASCGVHPLQSEGLIQDELLLRQYAVNPKVIAIGETGLDYFYEASVLAHEAQKTSFIHHLKAAGSLGFACHCSHSKCKRRHIVTDQKSTVIEIPLAFCIVLLKIMKWPKRHWMKTI